MREPLITLRGTNKSFKVAKRNSGFRQAVKALMKREYVHTHVLTDGGRELAQYPLNIYEKWVTALFTFLIPFGTFNYLPALYLLDRTDGPAWLYMAMPLAGVLFLGRVCSYGGLPCDITGRRGRNNADSHA